MKTFGDIKWLAGWLEGEGSFGLTMNGQRKGASLLISAGTVDLDIAQRVASILDARGVLGPYTYGNNQPLYRIHVSGVKAAGWMMTLYSLLGTRRRAQVRTALDNWRARPTRGRWLRAKAA